MAHTLLLADDSVTIQRVIELTFAGEDVRVVAVGDGQQAVDHVGSEPPDIVLADIDMPRLSGYDVATFVKTQPALSDIPVLLLTGAFEALDDARVKASGADGVLVKPFEPHVVISRVRELLGLRPARATAAPAANRLITPPPARRASSPRPEEPAPRAAPPPATPPASSGWDALREQTGLGPDARSVEVHDPAASDDYFDSLDAAFDSLDARLSDPSRPVAEPRKPAAPAPEAPPVFDVQDEWFGETTGGEQRPTAAPPAPPDARRQPPPPAPESRPAAVERPAASAPARPATPPPATSPVADAGPPVMEVVADAFADLLAAETNAPPAPPPSGGVAVSDGLVDQVTARVVERLSGDRLTDEIRAIVSETAERIIREEIRRIKGAAERRR